ncbi:hypothetical protein [Myxococcus sp. CA040A]|uniref:hypothetical protein n=1 Tax=Myxococcus sp. CA040A TaxID=2741738 RepID=UPI00157B61FB|nr:hypothetical protein [Myxococcus sp. CA040A]NTX07335.1 hypothetical protein [Myxococcus sp. CA040A]
MCRMMMVASVALFVGMTACGGMEHEESSAQVAEELGQSEALLWTGFTSEEHPPLQCDLVQLINGFECSGSKCDNIRVNCTNAGVAHGASYFTSQFSEEATSYRYCGANEWVTGVACYGNYCDNVALECTAIAGRSVGSCTWSAWYTDGSGAWQAPAGNYVRGAQCRGSNCDDMRFYYCSLL